MKVTGWSLEDKSFHPNSRLQERERILRVPIPAEVASLKSFFGRFRDNVISSEIGLHNDILSKDSLPLNMSFGVLAWLG